MADRDQPRVIVALDYPDAQSAMQLITRLAPDLCRLKIGKELFTRSGPRLVEDLVARGFDVFLDLKFHDIPNTVASACHAAAELGVWMLNVHALGGERMLLAAKEGVARAGQSPLLIAVTVLTSMDASDLAAVGLSGTPLDNVLRLAHLAQQSGLDGVVCSSQETATLRERLDAGFQLVTPGIRPAGSQADDQRRVMTPVDAVRSGSDYLVIGRPVTRADDPVRVLRTINAELSALT
ncbi:MAG: orotidine-5'-phosphate decarboxylase [Gammaproteobacteria bacterium]|jgi:orotidine-5'-phosphate decarboxylase|nr:orotidine-5'-phosphate decarboxylase [Gammaproteobacteria bacterium]